MDNLISIIIPTFNRKPLLERAIDSVLNQSFDNFEVIVVDNYSTDGTDELIARYKDNRISFHRNKNEGIIASSRNYGINLAKGNFLAFLDSDDWWESTKLDKCLSALRSGQIDFVYHNCFIKGGKIDKKTNCRKLNRPFSDDLLYNGNTVVTSSVVARRSAFELFLFSESRNKAGWEDYDLWIKLAKENLNFHLIEECLGTYWMGNDNFDNPKRIILNLESMESTILNAYREQSKKVPWWPYYTRGLAYYNLNSSFLSIKNFMKVLLLKAPFLFKLKAMYQILKCLYRVLTNTVQAKFAE